MNKNKNRIIMKTAHEITRATVNRFGGNYSATFSIVLKEIYAKLKGIGFSPIYVYQYATAIEKIWVLADETARGVVEMAYSKFKNNYSGSKTVRDSYNPKTKTIKVYMVGVVTNKVNIKPVAPVKMVTFNNGLCPKCNAYCFGDCSI